MLKQAVGEARAALVEARAELAALVWGDGGASSHGRTLKQSSSHFYGSLYTNVF